ncbi:MAG: DNA internalization-related competence protein ComEC/Rec2 [Deltaproteobacteria bacterium]|nr:DNA internalization-related competence protein ComEC/Rec2 [Deltaproteobacteria bacterium]
MSSAPASPNQDLEVDLPIRPLVFAAAGFCVGVAFGPSKAPWLDVILAIGATLVVAGLARAQRVLSVLLLPVPFFVAGLAVTAFKSPPKETVTTSAGYSPNSPWVFEGLVAEAPEQRPEGDRLIVDLIGAAPSFEATHTAVSGRMSLRIRRPGQLGEEGAPCGEPGDLIRFFARARVPEEALSPIRASPRALAARRGIALIGSATDSQLCARVGRRQLGLVVGMERARSNLHATIDRALPAPVSGVVRAFATGERSGIPKDVDEAFRASGLSHLLAVSGLNLAIVAGLFVFGVGWLIRRSRFAVHGAERLASIIAIPFVVLYTLLVGASPSAVRAAIMVLALIGSRVTRRASDAWSALSLALIAMLAVDPSTLGDLGFQLSFAAVAALLRIQPALAKAFRLKSLPTWARLPAEVAVASLAATIGTAPLIGRHFFRVSLVGVLANIPAAPLSSLILVPLSLLGGLVGFVSETLASPILALAGLAARALIWVARLSAGLPFAEIFVPRPSIAECLLFYGASIGLAARTKRVNRLGALALAALITSVAGHQLSRALSRDVVAAFLPVGQGDSSVVELPGGKVALIDAGPGSDQFDAGETIVAPWLHARRIGSLDLVILTHSHEDHVGGLPSLARRFEIRELWWNGDARDLDDDVREIIDRVPSRVVRPGESRTFGAARIEVVGPVRTATSYEDVNDGSLVVRVIHPGGAILFEGDAERVSELEMVGSGAKLDADVLKVGHHGSRSSSSDELLSKVTPRWAIMSLAKFNGFGFPHREALERLERAKTSVLRTDVNGLVVVEVDSAGVRVKPYRH